MSRIINRLRPDTTGQEGWVLVTAIVLMAIMLGVGLAVLATADTQTGLSRQERVRESSFNLAEGLLQAESVVLQNNWPNLPPCATNDNGCGYPAPTACTQAVGNANQCPDAANLAGNSGAFSNVDQSRGDTTWKIQVRDDLGVRLSNPPAGYSEFYDSGQIPTYYRGFCPPPNLADATKCWPSISGAKYSANPAQAPGADLTSCKNSANANVVCSWDANGNKQVWVRVDVTVQGKTRSLVALLHLESFPVTLNSKDAVNGGAVNFGNNGNKDIVDATGSQIVARCLPTTGANPSLGKILSTTVADVPVGNVTDTVVIPNNSDTQGFTTGMVVALGADTNNVPPYELLTIKTITANGATLSVQFTTKVLNPHIAGATPKSNKMELEPAPGNDPHPNNCETWQSSPAPGVNGSDKHQLDSPWNYKSDPNYPNFIDDAAYPGVVNGLKPWVTCPTTANDWKGNVYIKSVPAGQQCTIPNGTFNSSSDPHFIIVENETPINAAGVGTCNATAPLQVSGNTVYYGVIYMRNKQQCTYGQKILSITAGAQIQGGVAVDGHAGVDIGNASNSGQCAVQGGSAANPFCPTIKFDPVAFGAVAASGAAGLVQNTWRELAPGQ